MRRVRFIGFQWHLGSNLKFVAFRSVIRKGFNNPRHGNFPFRVSVNFLATDCQLGEGVPPFSVKKFPLTFHANVVPARGGTHLTASFRDWDY